MVEPSTVNDQTSKATSSSPVDSSSALPQLPSKDINRRVAVVSTLAALGLFVFTRLDFGVSLKDLSAAALPYEDVICFPCLHSYTHFSISLNLLSIGSHTPQT